MGREDIPQEDKEEFISSLIEFPDRCGGYYRYQAYFLAAQGVAEFADCQRADEIVRQLIEWRFGYFHPKKQKWWRYPPPIIESARIALLKTDRPRAIAALEQFITSTHNEFDSWNAAYSLGKVFDPGNQIAIAALVQLITTVRHESIRWQAAYNLGRVDPGNQIAIAALVQIIESTTNESTRRKAAYSLGKIDLSNALPLQPFSQGERTKANGHFTAGVGKAIAISTLEKIAASATDASQRLQAAENLAALRGITQSKQSLSSPSSSLSPSPAFLSSLLRGVASAGNDDTQRRRAYKLAKLNLGNLVAFTTLLQLMKSAQSESVRKRTAENLKEILLDEQLPEVIVFLKDCFSEQVCEHELEKFRESYKLLWHCAENMTYLEFYQVWHQGFPNKKTFQSQTGL